MEYIRSMFLVYKYVNMFDEAQAPLSVLLLMSIQFGNSYFIL
jgi:hypothetical protein